ncbi:nitronate monooxygenase [Variovorax sp. OK605]|uniref:NAD(P)H-dependent flavin oxidoreductase n=1 Tax=unclassified Variovorax TaxID=663243 RepID=UPI0008B476E3|nr:MULTISPECIES: nitronate monooxygenase [unclassified Variovorax]SEK08699.1 nitronate monooxygenase [Variovorax sp. OK202]SFD57982.1 nitronate monooxygenase [Variovorax sp. OK212]SFP85091.1 nitronate monooxygenase [Variovorax sp. OK605]
MPPVFRTRITELFGIAHPILGGGLMWLSGADYVAALVNAGCMGFITPRSFDSDEDFAQALVRCSALTGGKPFGVNLTLSSRPEANAAVRRWLDIALAHGVRFFETAGYAPTELIGTLHEAGAVVLHKAPSIRHALSAERAGADAIALIGMEEGGHPGTNELPTMLMGALAAEQFRVPVVLGGGIGHGRQLAAVLAQGHEGVMMGSRFLVCEEIGAHRGYKEHLLGCDEHSTVRLLHTLGNTWRVLRNDTARRIDEIERAGAADHAAFGDLISGRVARDHCYAQGDWQRGMLSLGPSIAFAKRIEPLAGIVAQLLDEARASLGRLSSLAQVPA